MDKGPAKPGEVALSVDGLTANSDRSVAALNGVSFDLRYGTISSIARKSDPYGLNYISNAKNTPEVDGNYAFGVADPA